MYIFKHFGFQLHFSISQKISLRHRIPDVNILTYINNTQQIPLIKYRLHLV